jgi:hypothetical protein
MTIQSGRGKLRKYRHSIKRAEVNDVYDDLLMADAVLTNALTCASAGKSQLQVKDRHTLLELINQVRNYIDHVGEQYL